MFSQCLQMSVKISVILFILVIILICTTYTNFDNSDSSAVEIIFKLTPEDESECNPPRCPFLTEDDHSEKIDLRKRNFQYFDKISNWPHIHVPWFIQGGVRYPKKHNEPPKLLPEQAEGDRILDQLMFVPENCDENLTQKIILSYDPLSDWDGYFGRSMIGYKFEECPVRKCILTEDKKRYVEADAVLFKFTARNPTIPKLNNQIWIQFFLESPYNTKYAKYPNDFNWTASYRRDSDISIPYGKWIYYDPQVREKPQHKNYALNKTKKVAWFVSNCHTHNDRLDYAKKLAKYIQVDIYGKCGSKNCPRTNRNCFESLSKDYKFYLAFENSNCKDYITEKLFENAFGYDILPIVMGTYKENYKEIAPQGSFIHVDAFHSPAELAEYLHTVDQDDDLYNSYFQWKGTGEFINHHFWCRLCSMLYADLPSKTYEDINHWWNSMDICQ